MVDGYMGTTTAGCAEQVASEETYLDTNSKRSLNYDNQLELDHRKR